MANFHEPQDFEDFSTIEDGMSTLLQKPVSAGVAPQLKLPGTKLPLFDYNEGNNQKRLPEYFGMDHTVKDILDCAATDIGLNMCSLGHTNLEAAARFFITPIIMVATSTTIAALGLEQQKLTFSLDALVTGNAAMREIDYLIECPHGNIPVKMVHTTDIFAPDNVGQLLAEMSAVRDQTKAVLNQALCINRRHGSDTFGVLSNGQQWALYTYQQGGSSVFFEHYELSMTEGKKVFIPQLSKLMSALVGIVKFQSSVMQ